VYKAVRAGLAARGVDVRWVGVGPDDKAAMQDNHWKAELAHGEVVGGDISEEQGQARALIAWLHSEGFDGVFVNAACNRVHSNVIRYLGAEIRRIMTVHTITVGTYAGARALRGRIHATVCVSPRIRDDLVKKRDFPQNDIRVIPNGIDIRPFRHTAPRMAASTPIRLLSLGRIIDSDKGVYWLPEIMKHLAGVPVHLTICGDGPDITELKRRCRPLGDAVSFLGRIEPSQVPDILVKHDVFLFPSRFEGLPLSLVEAMASGCVPVASRIKGVTDFVIRDGIDGLLFDMGDVRAAARHIRRLVEEPKMLATLSHAARDSSSGRFELSDMANDYYDVVRSVIERPCELKEPLPIDSWEYPPGLKPGLRSYLPSNVKKWLRVLRERIA
jgi:glycosyltransferase involved in cell wall biosynthesis